MFFPKPRRIMISCWLVLVVLVTAGLVATSPAAAAPDGGQVLPYLTAPRPSLRTEGEKAVSDSGWDYYIVKNDEDSSVLTDRDGNWGTFVSPIYNLYGMWGLDGQSIFIATGGNHGIYQYLNGTWLHSGVTGFQGYVWDIWGFDRDDVFALGTADNEFITNILHWNGIEWSNVTSLSPSSAFKALWGASPQALYMVGLGGDIARYNGQTLSRMGSGVTTTLNGIWGFSTSDIYAVGRSGTIIHYDGDGWTQQECDAQGHDLYSVWGSSAADVWVVGDQVVLHYDGSSWSRVETLCDFADFRDVYGRSASDLFVCGRSGQLFHFDGEGWQDQTFTTYGDFAHIWGGLRQDGDQYWAAGFGDPDNGGNGLDNRTYGIVPWLDGVAVSGNFTRAGAEEITRIAFWNGSNWSPLYQTSGANDYVYALEVYDGQLIAGGNFTQIDGLSINCVAAWDGSAWHQLGAGLPAPASVGVVDLCVWDGKLVAAGDSVDAAYWDGSTWTSLPGYGGTAYMVEEFDGDLYMGGLISDPGTGLLRFNGSAWEIAVAADGLVSSLVEYQGDLVVGGQFTTFGELMDVHGLMRREGTTWSELGGGTNGTVLMLQEYQGGLFVCGQFSAVDAGNQPAGSAAFWNGDSWQAMGSGVNDFIWSGALQENQLTLSGGFSIAGNHSSTAIAQWEQTELGISEPPITDPAQAGQDYTITINIVGDPGAYPVLLHYRRRDSEPWEVALMTPGPGKDGTYQATVPGSYLGTLGFQYYVSGGGTGNPVYYPAGGSSDPSYTGVVMVDESLGLPVANQYVMMGVPFVPDKGLDDLLTDAFGSYNPARWRFGRWNPLTSSYGEFPNVPAIAPGRGYWLIQKDPVDLPATGVSTSTVGNVVLTLEPGWNQIATPYNMTIAWSSVLRGPNVEDRLVARAGGGYVDVDHLAPWQGYWVRNTGLNATTITIPPTPMTKSAGHEDGSAAAMADALWSLTLAVEHGDRYDRQNVAGVVEEAEEGIDALDFFEPPALPGDVSLFFERSDGESVEALSCDMRPPFAEGAGWDVVLRLEGGGTVDLTVTGGAAVPGDQEVRLLTQDGSVDLRRTEHLTLRIGQGGETRLRLAVGDPDFVQEQEQSLPRPFAQRPVYPNPFNPKTTLGFSLPRTSHVSLDIFDLKGRLVRRLVDESFAPGMHEVTWNGLDDSGHPVSTGIYFSRLRAADFTQTRKMTLVR